MSVHGNPYKTPFTGDLKEYGLREAPKNMGQLQVIQAAQTMFERIPSARELVMAGKGFPAIMAEVRKHAPKKSGGTVRQYVAAFRRYVDVSVYSETPESAPKAPPKPERLMKGEKTAALIPLNPKISQLQSRVNSHPIESLAELYEMEVACNITKQRWLRTLEMEARLPVPGQIYRQSTEIGKVYFQMLLLIANFKSKIGRKGYEQAVQGLNVFHSPLLAVPEQDRPAVYSFASKLQNRLDELRVMRSPDDQG